MNNPIGATLAAFGQRVGGSGPLRTLDAQQRLDGLTCLVTGASSGLGKALAVDLARRGARVLMACRSGIPEAGDDVQRRAESRAVEMLPVDLSDLDSVRALCDTLRDRRERIDALVLNAGVMPRRARRTAQGFEEMFQVNFLASVLITRRLLEDGVIPNRSLARRPATVGAGADAGPNGHRTQRAAGAAGGATPRIVFVSSEVHRSAPPIDPATLGAYVEYGTFTGMAQYARSKLAVCTYANELSRRLRRGDDIDVAVHAICPGPIASNMAREAPVWIKPVLAPAMRLFFAPPAEAAKPVAYLAAAPAIEGQSGIYLHRSDLIAAAESSLDPDRGARLWDAAWALIQRSEIKA